MARSSTQQMHEQEGRRTSCVRPVSVRLFGARWISVEEADSLHDQSARGGTILNDDPDSVPLVGELAIRCRKELEKRCQGSGGACSCPSGGQHAQCRGKTARMAAVYHFKLCRAIFVGFRRQRQRDGICKDGFVGMLDAGLERESLPVLHLTNKSTGEVLKFQIHSEDTFRDDLTGKLLNPDLVQAARKIELQ